MNGQFPTIAQMTYTPRAGVYPTDIQWMELAGGELEVSGVHRGKRWVVSDRHPDSERRRIALLEAICANIDRMERGVFF